MGRRRCRMPDYAVDVRRHGNGRRPDASAEDRIRLGPRSDLRSARAARPSVRDGGSVRRRRHAPLRSTKDRRHGIGAYRHRTGLGDADHFGLAALADLGIMIGLSTGATANVLGATIATRWFTKRRGLVIGVLGASNATGQLLFLPAAAYLSEHFGWRYAMMPAATLCLTCLVLVLIVVRDHPSDVDLPSYGETTVVPAPSRFSGGNALQLSFAALSLAAGNRTFWILASTFFICGLSTSGLVQNHFIPLCHDFGVGTIAASGVLATMGAFDFVGTIFSGWLSDRFDNRWLLFWYYGLRGLSLLVLPYTDFSLYGLSIFPVFYGLDWISTVPPTVKLTGQTFGREKAPLGFGWIFLAHQMGAATAAFGAGVSRDA